MYKEIDDLVDAIVEDDIFKKYQVNNQKIKSEEMMPLLTKHQMIQEDYMKMKSYEPYVSIDETRKKLKDVKDELSHHPFIQDYYQSYYQLNDLLDEVTQIVFDGISKDIYINRWKQK